MKKILLIVVTISSLSAFSQSGRPPRGEKPEGEPKVEMQKKEKISVEDKVQKLTTDLKLNETQQLQVRELILEQEKKHNVSFSKKDKKDASNREEMKAQMEKEREIEDQKFKKILTPEQYSQWNKKREEDQKGKPFGESKNSKKPKKEFSEK